MGFLDSSVGKESACSAGDPGLIPSLGRSIGEGIGIEGIPTPVFLGFLCGSAGKESAHNVGDLGKVPWRRERLPTPVFWPGEFHPWDHKESDMTE